MRTHSLASWFMIAAFAACAVADDPGHEHHAEEGLAAVMTSQAVDPPRSGPTDLVAPGHDDATPLRLVDPPQSGPTDPSAPEDDDAEDDHSALVVAARELAARGEALSPPKLPRATSIEVLRDIEADEIVKSTDGSYASIKLDGVLVHVVNRSSPPRRREIPDLVLDVGARDLAGLTLVASYTRDADGSLDLRVKAYDDGSGAGSGRPVGADKIKSPGGCTADAFAGLGDDIPAGMPPIKFPTMTGDCSANDCVEIRRSWIRGHISVFYAHLLVEWVASLNAAQRSFVWGRPGRNAQGNLASPRTAPSYWFGAYDAGRFSKIREVVNDTWNVFRNGKTGGIPLRQHCPVAADVGNVCFTSSADAHHWVKGRIEYCDSFFDYGAWNQTWISVHESIHHLWVNGLMVGDTHTHWHGASCLSSPVTETIYGEAEVRHLVTYKNSGGGACNHRDIATRTVDAYAQMILWFGGSFLNGSMVAWPAWGDPTPEPPECKPSDLGTEGCQCATVQPFGDDSTPDGDFAIDKHCYDNTGHEMSCVATKFNASDTVGICTRCEATQRAAGCECEHTDDCAPGLFCYGADTWNGGGTGHCYDEDPPSWVCLADCERLFNDPYAWCYHERPGGARCLDFLCDEPTEYECMMQGKACRYGECVVECHSQADCHDLGFPAAFVCQGNVCQRPDAP